MAVRWSVVRPVFEMVGQVGLEPTTTRFGFVLFSQLARLYLHPRPKSLGWAALMKSYWYDILNF